MWFYHGEADRVVYLDETKAMVTRLRGVGVPTDLYVVPGAGHVRAFFDAQAARRGIEFLDKYLKAAGGEALSPKP
jgi:dipeptidyl aminopeptidase/acylaminoacyl peptidase